MCNYPSALAFTLTCLFSYVSPFKSLCAYTYTSCICKQKAVSFLEQVVKMGSHFSFGKLQDTFVVNKEMLTPDDHLVIYLTAVTRGPRQFSRRLHPIKQSRSVWHWKTALGHQSSASTQSRLWIVHQHSIIFKQPFAPRPSLLQNLIATPMLTFALLKNLCIICKSWSSVSFQSSIFDFCAFLVSI